MLFSRELLVETAYTVVATVHTKHVSSYVHSTVIHSTVILAHHRHRSAINKDADLSTTSCQQLQQLSTSLAALQRLATLPALLAALAAAPGSLVQGEAIRELLNDPQQQAPLEDTLPWRMLRAALGGGAWGAAVLVPAQLYNDAAAWGGEAAVCARQADALWYDE